MTATLDDENKLTRLYTSKIIKIILGVYKHKIDMDKLHKMYPEIMKRLDDNSEDIRFETLNLLDVYFQNLNTGSYDKILYQAHLKALYEGLLIHLDDANVKIQEKVLGKILDISNLKSSKAYFLFKEILKTASVLSPELLTEEILKVKDKHRTPRYCDELLDVLKYEKKIPFQR